MIRSTEDFVGSEAPILSREKQVGARPENVIYEKHLISRGNEVAGKGISRDLAKFFRVASSGSRRGIEFIASIDFEFNLRPPADHPDFAQKTRSERVVDHCVLRRVRTQRDSPKTVNPFTGEELTAQFG